MKSSLRVAAFGMLLALGSAGCTGGHGFLGTDFEAGGNIMVVDLTTNKQIVTSVGSPFVDSIGGFSVGIEETNVNGPYTVTMIKWNNGFSIPCFEPTDNGKAAISEPTDPVGHVNTITFTVANANPPTDPVTQANPCIDNGTDEETAQISDGKGNVAYFYFVLG